MSMTKQSSRAVLAVLMGLALGCSPEINIGEDEGATRTCVESDQCPNNEICWEGLCIPGECVRREDCPKPGDQLCVLNRCVPDPDSPIDDECPNGDRDCDMGEFCSAGTCYAVSDSQPCQRSTDCKAGERCDPVNNFCVQDRGGCNRANEYPELACLPGEVCDALTGQCQPPQGIPCTPATAETDCGVALQCIANRCVQCTSNTNCGQGDSICCDGFGTQCNVATGRCVSAFVCSVHEDCTGCRRRPGLDATTTFCADGSTCAGDADCDHLSDRRCNTATGECVRPECISDYECSRAFDGRWVCDAATMRCILPPAQCEEENEPNNSFDTATPVTTGEFVDVLCRGDMDVLAIPGHADKRLRLDVVLVGYSGWSAAVTLGLYDANGVELDSGAIDWYSSAQLRANVPEDGTYYLRMSNSTQDVDYVTYELTVVEDEPLQCNTEPGEPNNVLSQASNSVLVAGHSSRILCGSEDKDYHQLTVPAEKQLTATVEFNYSEGDIDAKLLDLDGDTLDSSTTSGNKEQVELRNRTTEDQTVVLYVYRYTSSYYGFEEEQEYSVDVVIDDPPNCSDGFEPNDSEGDAPTIASGTYQGNMCDLDDIDMYRVDLPNGGDIAANVSFFDMSGNIQLALLKPGGVAIDLSTNYDDYEEVSGSNLQPGHYFIEVYPSEWSYPVPDRQPYTLTVAVSHDCADDELEGSGNNDATTATPLRDEAATSFEFDEELKLCGTDSDWYRLVLLGGELLDLSVTGPTGIFAELYRSSAQGALLVGTSRALEEIDGQSRVGLLYHVPGRAAVYFARIGGGGNRERAYALQINVEADMCAEDALEFNDSEALATEVARLEGGAADAVLCPVLDRDLYATPLSVGQTLEVSAAFDASQGDLDLALWHGAEVVVWASATQAHGPAEETMTYVVDVSGDYVIDVSRKTGSGEDPIEYSIAVAVTGEPVDAGAPDSSTVDAIANDAAEDAGSADILDAGVSDNGEDAG